MTKKRKKPYFSEPEELAVVQYINSDSYEEKQRIYNQILMKPFITMTETILRKYPIHIGNYEINEVEADCLSHLVENFIKFNKDKITKTGQKAKAFSYCQTIVRNFYRDHGRKSYAETTTQLRFEDYFDEIENSGDYHYELTNNSDEKKVQILIKIIVKKMKDRIDNDISLKKNEVIVGEAIINVLENWDLIFLEDEPVKETERRYNKKLNNSSVFAKQKILLMLKEQTNLSTKEIRSSMKCFKELYDMTKRNFFENDEE